MELVRAEKSLVWVCWREAGLFQQDERTVPCLCYAALSVLCKNAEAGEPVSRNFHFLYASQLEGSPFCREIQEWPKGMGSTAAPALQELGHVCFHRELMSFAVVLSLPKLTFFLFSKIRDLHLL